MVESRRSPHSGLSTQVLLGTKLFVPSPRPNLVSRSRLLRQLDEGLSARLILVSGPAGFGKTTLLRQWLAQRSLAAGWLSLDARDNDPVRFMTYLVAALQNAAPGIGKVTGAALRSPQPPAPEAVLAGLVNELCSEPDEIVLVLDDYHVITAPSVHGALGFLLDNMPPRLHLVVATRADPHLPISRLRSQGVLVELRGDVLRFTTEEAAAFLQQTMDLRLSPEDVAVLEARTEGWIAGLQMAALSMCGRQDISAFIRAFTGSHRYILDFLIEEVLSRESQPVQHFLLRTAILDQLTASLCDALTGNGDGQATLEDLERRNLFVVSLDDERRWYRYHHLFAEVLLNQVRKLGPGILPDLHVKASDWYERAGLADHAFHHAALAEDYGRARRLFVANWLPVAHSGRTATVLRWLEALPRGLVRTDAILSFAYAWILWLMGDTKAIEEHLDDASHTQVQPGRQDSVEDRQRADMPSAVAGLRSHVARQRGEIRAALRYAEEAIALAPENAALALAQGYSGLGHAYLEGGELTKGIKALAQGIALSEAGGNILGAMVGTFYLARAERKRGHLGEAERICRDALRQAQERGTAGAPASGMLHLALAAVLLERGDLAGAERHLLPAAELAKHAAYVYVTLNYGLISARLRQARGDVAGALAAIRDAERNMRGGEMPLAAAELAAFRARLHLATGDLTQAARWVAEALERPGDDTGHTREVEALSIARVLTAGGDTDAAVTRLTQSLASAEAGGQHGSAIEILTLRALALYQRGERQRAVADLGRVLLIAEPEGYLQVFLDEGPSLVKLLGVVIEDCLLQSPSLANYAKRLLSLCLHVAQAEDDEGKATTTACLTPGLQELAEPLSQRELEILGLLAQGYSNQDIASHAVISLNTVKRHTSNIFGKLGVSSRTQAIARARELRLIS